MAADVQVFKWILVCLVCITQISIGSGDNSLHFVKDVRILKYEYGKTYTIFINNTVEYIYENQETHKYFDSSYPARVSVSSQSANRSFPIFITARQQKGILSWQLPIMIDDRELRSLSRTLCPYGNVNASAGNITSASHPYIHIYTSSLSNISLTLRMDLVDDFYLTLNEKRTLTISPSEPSVYFYSFKNDRIGESISESSNDENRIISTNFQQSLNESMRTLILRIDSEDDHCMLVSIQNYSCPVYDTENDILFEGFYETVSKRGGITISEKRFPNGFFIVLLVKTTDEDCTGYSSNDTISKFTNFFTWDIQPFDNPDDPLSPLGNQNMNTRHKTLIFSLYPTITYLEYWLATSSALIVIFILYITFLLAMYCYKMKPMTIDEVDNSVKVSHHLWKNKNVKSACDGQASLNFPYASEDATQYLRNAENNENINSEYGPDITEATSPNTQDGSRLSLELQKRYGIIYLNQLCKKNAQALSKQSALYVWHLITIAVFYGLPVIQLVITYQRVLNRSGNQDLCYYNFLCAHPLGYLSDFNHVYSNLGYVLLGMLFIFIVWRRRKLHEDGLFDEYFGIPQHFGLYYAMGVALMMEGVLSASYHVCPNNSNFQFDTSFMYIMAVICMVKIYQCRHPDINARAHSTFGVLAAAILICLIGVLYPNIYFWIFFTLLHIGTCFLLTFQIYYLGQWKFTFCCCAGYKCGNGCKPTYRSRLVLVLIANMVNMALAGYGLYMHSKDFATHLLYVFLMNLALHLTFYITMKVTKGERPTYYAWLLLLLAIITWGGALYFFFNPSTSWAVTPAQSRAYNKPCSLFNFYDNHDIWHMLSAAAMFFSFMLLLTLDDDITHKPRNNIQVF